MKKILISVFLLAFLTLLPLLSSDAFADFVGLGDSHISLLNEPTSLLFTGVGLLLVAGFFRKASIRN